MLQAFTLSLLRKVGPLLWVVPFALSLFVSGCQNYDKLVEKDQIADEKWANLQAQLQRRYDLIPNMVATVKASAKNEQQTLEQVAQARASATSIKMTSEDLTDPAKMAAFEKAQEQLKGSLSRLMMVQEQYPALKASQDFHALEVELEGTENRILRAREDYNAAVRDYNTELGKIRGQVVNKVTGHPFKPRVMFTASSDATAAPKVSF